MVDWLIVAVFVITSIVEMNKKQTVFRVPIDCEDKIKRKRCIHYISLFFIYQFMKEMAAAAAPNQEHTLTHIRVMLTRLLTSNRKTLIPKDILMVVVRGMEYFDLLMADQSGEFKKHTLLQLLQKAVSALDIPDSTKTDLINYIQSPELSLIIDLLVTAAKGKFNIKKRRKWFRRFFSCWCCKDKTDVEVADFEHSIDNMIDIPLSPPKIDKPKSRNWTD